MAGWCAAADAEPSDAAAAEPREWVVTTTADSGKGSLRQAMLDARGSDGPDTIAFDRETFGKPRTITLESPLPNLTGEVTLEGYIEDRLWLSCGAVISGGGRHRVFRVLEGARVVVRSLTVADGSADEGAGILNEGTLVVEGVAFLGSVAGGVGGGIVNRGGTLTAINSTFAGNRAGAAGGGIASLGGSARVTNCTFSENEAPRGAGLFADGALELANTILANSVGGLDCVAIGPGPPVSVRNLIETGEGCGTPISSADPRLGTLGYFNGPTKIFPLGGGSPAVNLGDNAAAVDADGEPLAWDQRGNGDPRFVAGFTDIGSFEQQAFPKLVVDTVEDSDLRGCTAGGAQDCPLRGALELAEATPQPDVITFDPRVFDAPRTITLTRPLPRVRSVVLVDAGDTPGVVVEVPGDADGLDLAAGAGLGLRGLVIRGREAPAAP